jgi:hypothetical protein
MIGERMAEILLREIDNTEISKEKSTSKESPQTDLSLLDILIPGRFDSIHFSVKHRFLKKRRLIILSDGF